MQQRMTKKKLNNNRTKEISKHINCKKKERIKRKTKENSHQQKNRYKATKKVDNTILSLGR